MIDLFPKETVPLGISQGLKGYFRGQTTKLI